MKTITALVVQKRNKERVNLFLDGEYRCSLSLAVATGLRRGQVISDPQLEELVRADELERAYERALRYLAYRPRSTAEIERLLREHKADAETVGSVVERLQRMGYLDDEAFARFWVENRDQFRPRSRRALRYELRQKGVADEIITSIVDEIPDQEAAWKAVQPKLQRWSHLDEAALRSKIAGHLGRRGFDYELIDGIVRRAWEVLHSHTPGHEPYEI